MRRGGKRSKKKTAKLNATQKAEQKKVNQKKEAKKKAMKQAVKRKAKAFAKAVKEKKLLKPLATGASVIIATDSPRFGWGLVRRGEVGTLTHVETIPALGSGASTGSGAATGAAVRTAEVTVRFPAEGEWRGELGDIAPAPPAPSAGRSVRRGAADLPPDEAAALGLVVVPHADESSAAVVASCGGALGPLACEVKRGAATAIAAPLDARVGAAPGRWYYEWTVPMGAKKGGIVRVGWANMAAMHVYSPATKEGAPREQMPWPHPDAGELSFVYRYILRESCSQFESLALTSLTQWRSTTRDNQSRRSALLARVGASHSLAAAPARGSPHTTPSPRRRRRSQRRRRANRNGALRGAPPLDASFPP